VTILPLQAGEGKSLLPSAAVGFMVDDNAQQ